MTTRRSLLKLLALAPAVFSTRSYCEIFGGTTGPCKCINILLHGFFFLEFQKDEQGQDMLVAVSPTYSGHCFYFRDHGKWQPQQVQPMYDLRSSLTRGSHLTFPEEMLQFSRGNISAGSQYFIDLTKSYALVLKLPPPRNIVALRKGLRSDLKFDPGNVATSIANLAKSANVGLVMRLKYDSTTDPLFPVTRNFYAEHCYPPDLTEMKNVMDAARAVFGKQFDLNITSIPNVIVQQDGQSDLPAEISPDDETALMEGEPCYSMASTVMASHHEVSAITQDAPGDGRSVQPATCPILGIMP
jgi:hypothetical protein